MLPVSVIVPVYNEEAIIENSVSRDIEQLRQFNCDYEILIINDGSSDQSAQIIDRCFGNKPEIKIIHKQVNEGFGSAIKTGVEFASKEHLLCIPADSPLTSEVLQSFLQAASRADVIVSYRLKREGYSARMQLNSLAYHFIVRSLFRIHLRDFNWIHMYHRRIFENGTNIRSKGIFMLAEVLIDAKRKGYTFHEIPVRQTQRITGVATASKLSTIFKTLKEIFAYYRANHSG